MVRVKVCVLIRRKSSNLSEKQETSGAFSERSAFISITNKFLILLTCWFAQR